MRAEVQKIFILYEELVEAGNNATLMFLSKGGKSTIKLQLDSPSPSPLTATTTTFPPAPGHRRRVRGAAAGGHQCFAGSSLSPSPHPSLPAYCFWEATSDVSGEAGHPELLLSQPGWLHLSNSSPTIPTTTACLL